jgi:hypothetical protein
MDEYRWLCRRYQLGSLVSGLVDGMLVYSNLRYSCAIFRASDELVKSEPVTINFRHPTSLARWITALRSSGCFRDP